MRGDETIHSNQKTHESCATARGGQCRPPHLEVIQMDKQKVFPFPVAWSLFPCMEDWEGGKLKFGLLKCNQSPAHTCRSAMNGGCGVGCEGLADPRLFVHVGSTAGGDGARFGTRCHPSALQPPAILCTEVSCSGRLPTVTGREIGVLNLSLYPFFLWKCCDLKWKGGTYWKTPPYTCMFLPLARWAAAGLLGSLIATEWTNFQPEDAGWLSWERLCYSWKKKRCRDPSDSSVFGC